MIKKITSLLIAVGVLGLVAVPVYAQSTCGSTKTQLVSCSGSTGVGAIGDLISIAVSVMTVLIGIVAVGSLAYAGIIYAAARDNQEQVAQARGIIRNVILALVLYGFTIAILNWLIPGGIISGGSSDASPSPSTSVSPSPSASPASAQ